LGAGWHMRRFSAAFLFFFVVSAARAEIVSFDFNSVSLVAFAQAIYRNVLHRDFVIAPDALSLDRKFSLSLRAIDSAKVPALVDGILLQQGVVSELRDGVYYLDLSRDARSALLRDRAVADGVSPYAGASGAPGSSAAPVGVSGASPGSSVPPVDPVHSGVVQRPVSDVSQVYESANRSVEFLVDVIKVAFGERAAVVAGGQVVLSGSEADVEKMFVLLRAIDRLPKMVDVSASWVEVTETGADQQGITVMANVLGAKLGLSLGVQSGAASVSLKGANFGLVLDALRSDGRFRQVSNSRIVGDDYQKMTLIVGDETPTIASTGKDNAGNTVQNVVYRASGVIVDVLPKVLGSGKVNLVIDGQISSFKATATGVVGSPTLIKRQVKTAVTVSDGDVLLIGGLNDSQDDLRSSGLSFLPAAWSLKNNTKTRTDLVLILSAKVSPPG
jgi:general secretion pathway protein D